ncbi:MAG: hypothetical protein ABGW78_14540, partial [Pirellulales bacterium]
MSVYGSPKSNVNKFLAPVFEEHEQRISYLIEQKAENRRLRQEEQTRLESAQRNLSAEYKEAKPEDKSSEISKSRNPLKALSKSRATKTTADKMFSEQFETVIAPIQLAIRQLDS